MGRVGRAYENNRVPLMHAETMEEKKYDPLERAEKVAKIVCREDMRKYYRFRTARFYGGIATADCVGCCLRCIFCWSWLQVVHPDHCGRFYSPREVAKNLISIARKKRFRHARISGNEPTLSREHLIKVLELIPQDILFILETNGILIGSDRTYARDLKRFGNLFVRVSLKGCTNDEFSLLTGAHGYGFDLQINALEYLREVGVSVHPAVMVSFSSSETVRSIRARLRGIVHSFDDIEIEELVLYGDVEDRVKHAGLTYKKAHSPKCIPPEQI